VPPFKVQVRVRRDGVGARPIVPKFTVTATSVVVPDLKLKVADAGKDEQLPAPTPMVYVRPAACVELFRMTAPGGVTERVVGIVPRPTVIEVDPVRLATGFTTTVAVVELPPGSQLTNTAVGVAVSTFAACMVPMQAVSPSSATTALAPNFLKTDKSISGPFLFVGFSPTALATTRPFFTSHFSYRRVRKIL
jgi:hypothetical protein